MGRLAPGDTVVSKGGVTITVKKFLGEGGQGAVYLVDYNGSQKALKWYHQTYIKKLEAKDFYENLSNNIFNGAPTKSFLWPQDLTKWSGNDEEQYGYIMDVRSSGFNELTDFYMRKVVFKSDIELLTACINIVEGFRNLHNKGYSYQDINNGNFFINKDTGEVLICDNDNVSVNKSNFGIKGKQRYMAPEIVLGGTPDKFSDRFSLAVVLFRMLFCGQHPLEGKYSTPPCMTTEFEKRYYGSDPVFLFDPSDKRNEPVSYLNDAAMKLWPLYPDYIHDLFIKTFNNVGVKNPGNRPIEVTWLEALIKLRSELVKCPKCGREIFLDAQKAVPCSKCGTALRAPYNFVFDTTEIPVVPGSKICKYQIEPASNECNNFVGQVLRNQSTNEVGLGNLSNETWTAIYDDGTTQSVAPKSVVVIKPGLTVMISNKRGKFMKI